jgi:hypothetical protein
MLLARYPGSELVPETLYNLYNVNKRISDQKSETYRQRLLTSHPLSEFARILSDPAYYEKKLADLKMVESMYQEAYNLYRSEEFNNSIALCDNALEKYSQDPLAPKFMLLRAYSLARISDERTFRNELTKITKEYPQSDESRRATEIIAFIDQEIPELKVEEEKVIAGELFVADTTTAHIFALVIIDRAFNINLATFDVISHNIDNYTNNNYRTQGELVDNKYIIITVSGFRSYRESLSYYNQFSLQKIVRNPSSSKMMTFIISNDNLTTLGRDKNPERYSIFFKENYLNEKD